MLWGFGSRVFGGRFILGVVSGPFGVIGVRV